jgi:hypothetical protein
MNCQPAAVAFDDIAEPSHCTFQVYCHDDGTCSLKVLGQQGVRRYHDVPQAIEAARQFWTDREPLVTVYSSDGMVISETQPRRFFPRLGSALQYI